MRVRPRDGECSLLALLCRRFPHNDAATWRGLCERGRLSVDGAVARADTWVREGQSVGYDLSEHREPPTDPRFRIISDDGRVIAIDKPGNLPVHRSGPYFRGNLMFLLRNHYPGERLRLVARLDRETSGLVLVCRDAESSAALQSPGASQKRYLCIVQGRPRWRFLRCEAPIGQAPLKRYRRSVGFGREAITELRVRSLGGGGSAQGAALVEAWPITGRTHQIRAHLGWLGHPILGDRVYGGPRGGPQGGLHGGGAPTRHLLHAYALRFHYGDVTRELRSPLPTDFREAAARLSLGLS